MGRIKNLIPYIVFAAILMLSSCENTLLEVVENRVEAATSITIDLDYTGTFEISESMPVVFRFYPNPFSGDPETDQKIKDITFTKQDTYLIPEAALTKNGSGKYFVVIFHDLDNSAVEDGIEVAL